jgi:hypothetical protein
LQNLCGFLENKFFLVTEDIMHAVMSRAFNSRGHMDFTTLFSFLERFGPEVEGRELAQPDAELAAKLIRFARGECDATERSEACEILRVNPTWLRWLADQVRLSRPEMNAATVAAD